MNHYELGLAESCRGPELVCIDCDGPAEGNITTEDGDDVCDTCHADAMLDEHLDAAREAALDWIYQEVEDEHGNVYQPWSK